MLGPQMDSIETTSPVIQHSSGHSSARLTRQTSPAIHRSSAKLDIQTSPVVHHSSAKLQGISNSPEVQHHSLGTLGISTSPGAYHHSSGRLDISSSARAQHYSPGRLGGSTSPVGGTSLGRLDLSPGAKPREVTLDIHTSPVASFPQPTASSTPRRPGAFSMRQGGGSASASAQMRQGASFSTSMRQTSSASSPRRHGASSYSATSPGRHGSSSYGTSGYSGIFTTQKKKRSQYGSSEALFLSAEQTPCDTFF